MPTLVSTPFKSITPGLGAVTALAICFTPLPLLAQDQPSEQENPEQEEAPSRAPIPLVPGEPTWNSFHGQLNAQKYSPLDQINTDNVGELEKVWEVHTGDVADGSGNCQPPFGQRPRCLLTIPFILVLPSIAYSR